MQVLKNKCIYSYYSTLLDMWVEWNSKLLMGEFPKDASTLNEALREPTSDCRSRAKEMFRIGLVSTELTQGDTALQAMRLGNNVQSDLGFVAAVIHKAGSKMERDKFVKAESALCAIFSVIQSVSWGNFETSINSIAHRLLEVFPCPSDINLTTWLRYLLSGVFCPIASADSSDEVKRFTDFFEHKTDSITLSIIADKTYKTLCSLSSVEDVRKAISDRVSLTGIVQQKMALFILGTERDDIPRGFLSMAYLHHSDFLKLCYEVEQQLWDNNPFRPLYDEESSSSGKYNVLKGIEAISSKDKDLEREYNKVMKDIYQGAQEALNLFGKGLSSLVFKSENCLLQSSDAREFVWSCVKEFHKEGILKDLFHSDYASKGGNQRDYWVVNGCFCSYIVADQSYADEPLEFEGKWICDGFRVDGGAEDVMKFGDAINDVFEGRYKVVIEGDIFKLLKIVTLDEPRQQIFFGAPGTGKSFRVEQITKIYGEDVIRTTFHPDSDYSTFVGCYKPTMKEAEEARVNQPILDYDSLVDKFKEYLNVPNANITKACSLFGYNYHDSIVRMQEQGRRVMDLVNDAYKSNTTYDSVVRGGMACYEEGGTISQSNEAEIAYSFVPQAFTQAYTRAWKNQGRPIFLVIEELNRGNCAQIFGDIFQLLDRNEENESSYSIIPDRDLQQHLADEFKNVEGIPADIKSGKSMRLPANL